MADVTFRQDPHFSTEKFVLQENALLIIGGAPPQRTIPLSRVSPAYDQIQKRFHSGYLVPVVLAAASAIVAWRLLDGDPSVIRTIIAGILGFMALVFLFMMKFKPVEGSAFSSLDGAPLFELYRPTKSPWTYDEFLSTLVRRITGAADSSFRE